MFKHEKELVHGDRRTAKSRLQVKVTESRFVDNVQLLW